jgi:acyl carrier protein
MHDVDARLRKLVSQLFHVDPETLRDDTRRGELDGWDSLGHLDLVAAIEEEFGLTLDPDAALEIESFGDARRTLAGTLGDV